MQEKKTSLYSDQHSKQASPDLSAPDVRAECHASPSQEQQHALWGQLESIRHLSQSVAHDLNNALMPIQTFSEFLISNPGILDDPEEATSILNDIHNAAKNAARMLRRLGSASRVLTPQPRYAAVHLTTLLEEAYQKAQGVLERDVSPEARSMTISPNLASLPTIHCHALLMRDAFAGILLDAMDSHADNTHLLIEGQRDANDIVLTLCTRAASQAEAPSRSIPSHKSFFGDSETEDLSAGLIMAYSIIRGHGGHLDIESTENGQTTYTVRLLNGK